MRADQNAGFRCDNIEVQEENSLAVNRWIPPHLKDCRPRRFRARFPRVALILIGLIASVAGGVGAPAICADDDVNKAAQELARKLAAQLDPKQAISIKVQDLTEVLSASDRGEVAGVFASELIAYGFRAVSDGSAEPTVCLTLSASSSARLWIAEFTRDTKPQVVFVSFARGNGRAMPTDTGFVRIEHKLVYEQGDPILDFVITKRQGSDAKEILVLGLENLALYDQKDGIWRPVKSVPIPHKAPLPRDPRGLLFFNKDNGSLFAGIPGTSCDGDFRSGLSLKCDSSHEIWSFAVSSDFVAGLDLIANRNFFQPPGTVRQNLFSNADQSNSQLRNFFTGAGLKGDGGVNVEARLDGRLWLQVGEERPLPLTIHLGSDIASIGGGCIDNTAILATGGSDYTSLDQVQVFQISDHRLIATSPPVEMPGPVNSLQQLFSLDPVRAVVHNLKTGNYEAYEITVACDR